MANVPQGKAKQQLNLSITRKAAEIMVDESTAAYHQESLQLSASGLNSRHVDMNFGLEHLKTVYCMFMPCLTLLLTTILTAENDYERKKGVEKRGKENMAAKIIVVILIIMGVFLSSSGASHRIIDTFNHMGLSVSYQMVQTSLKTLSEDAKLQAQSNVKKTKGLWGVVYDNINFTLCKASQRLDSATQQINATTLAVFSLPKKFTRKAYAKALSIAERNKLAGLRRLLYLDSLTPSIEKHAQVTAAFKHTIRSIILANCPGKMCRRCPTKLLCQHTKKLKPKIRCLSSEKTHFFPLPALNEEEASMGGTIRVIKKIYTTLLGLAVEIIEVELCLLVGDWLTIRNLRLMKDEQCDEFSSFLRFDWVQEAAMPFHFQLNALYMICQIHLGTMAQQNPSSLEHHCNLLRRAKLDTKKPEYNKAKELVMHSLIAHILDCTRIVLSKRSVAELKDWKPSCDEFEKVVDGIYSRFMTTSAAHEALEIGDEVLAHSILFIRDSLFFWEFCDAIRDADVGRMWVVYDFWVYMMHGAGCHNYGNEILEMKAMFTHEFPWNGRL
ncbi:hypothetical protein CPB84DRAFT_1854765 [Gymnopilus junonius]|uniref:DUF6589 domain-containing protein n=1 Tax=Gymnopilus junonius TaxID=109634 RepID=A0A9P5TGF9_GYMJU|nr:hypothetical protein CPB84DRAFT_1854765 [Gymnopilus junonius]